MEPIQVLGGGTHCLNCDGTEYMHRMGCRCWDLSNPDALEKYKLEYGVYIVDEDRVARFKSYRWVKEAALNGQQFYSGLDDAREDLTEQFKQIEIAEPEAEDQ